MVRLAWTTNRVWLLAVPALLIVACGGRSVLGLDEADDAGVGVEGGSDSGTDALTDVVYDHVNDVAGCNPNTCGGCCDDQGACRTGVQSEACGIGGYACVDCTVFDASCNASTHQCGPAASCGPASCPNGCCDDGVCVDGTSSGACGTGGVTCTICPMGSVCDPAIKQCVSEPGCGPWNCDGCCVADTGECSSGFEAWACGSGGQTCDICEPWEICEQHPESWGGVQCMGGPPPPVDGGPSDCGPWNCDGCCTMNGVCRPGLGDQRCGQGGVACQNCAVQNLVCEAGDCVP